MLLLYVPPWDDNMCVPVSAGGGVYMPARSRNEAATNYFTKPQQIFNVRTRQIWGGVSRPMKLAEIDLSLCDMVRHVYIIDDVRVKRALHGVTKVLH